MEGLIDFGDMVHSWLVNDVAIAAAYVLITLQYADGPAGPRLAQLEALAAIVRAYDAQLPLREEEWRVLPTLIASRIAMSLTIGAFSSSKDPDNEYLKLTLRPGWEALKQLRATPAAALEAALRRTS